MSESLVAERSDPGLSDGGVRPSGHADPHAASGTAHADGGSCAEPHPGAGRPDPDGSAPAERSIALPPPYLQPNNTQL